MEPPRPPSPPSAASAGSHVFLPALRDASRHSQRVSGRQRGWVWVVPTAFSPLPTRASFGVFMPRMGAAFWLPFFFSGGGRSGLWAACPACSFPPAAMQTRPLVIPTPSPRPPLLPPGPGFGVWDGDGFGLAVFSVLRVWVLGGTQRPEAFSWGCGHFWAALLPGAGSPLWCRMALG